MANTQELRRGRHCVFALHVHLVFCTKYRRCVFSGTQLASMQATMRAVCAKFGAELVEFNGERDHVHLLLNYPPSISLSTLVGSLKGVSSRMLRKEFGPLHPWLKRRGVLWSPSYFAASCGGAPIEILKTYIQQQDVPS